MKKRHSAICSHMDGPRDDYTKKNKFRQKKTNDMLLICRALKDKNELQNRLTDLEKRIVIKEKGDRDG